MLQCVALGSTSGVSYLVRGQWVETRLPPCREVTEHLDGVGRASQIRVDPETA